MFRNFLHEKCINREKQSIPRQRTQKNEEDGSLHFFHRPPENGFILHRSCVIYDGGRPPVSQRKLGGPNRKLRSINNKKIPQHWEVGPSQPPAMAPQPCGEAPPPPLPHFEFIKVWYAPGLLRSPGAINNVGTIL